MKNIKGFTLLEILIAFFVFTLLAVMTTISFRLIINSTQQTSQLTQQLAKLQTAFIILERDLYQVIDRKIIDESNQTKPSFTANDDSIEFTHLGAINPHLAHNAHIERVQYRWDATQHQLLRITWQVLDRVPSSQGQAQPLLNNIEKLSWRFYDDKLKTYPNWPANQQNQQSQQSAVPAAIELNITLKNQGQLTRLIKINGGTLG